jgi:hypothetical protein
MRHGLSGWSGGAGPVIFCRSIPYHAGLARAPGHSRPAVAWARQTIKEGSQGSMVAACAALRGIAVPDTLPAPDVWLVLRRHMETGELKTSLCNAPRDTAVETWVRLSGMRWPIGVSRQGHTIQSVQVRPRRKDSGLVAWEAPWRANKTVEPSDIMLSKEHAQHTRL